MGRTLSSLDVVDAVPTPLCHRPADIEASFDAVSAAYAAALGKAQAAAGRGAFLGPDAPTPDDLESELGWLLMDACCIQDPGSKVWRPLGRTELAALQGGRRRQTRRQPLRLRMPLVALAELWTRRLRERVPLQYLTHAAHWRDMVLTVGPGVLIPRPETELMIDLAAAALACRPALAAMPWADLGTGSGALACALAGITRAGVYAVDLSPAATAMARANARQLGLEQRVHVVQGCWAQPLLDLASGSLRGRCGGVLSNPPYIPSEDVPGLQAEVSRHEPWLALDGGPAAALESLRPVVHGAAALLAPGGFLALETGGPSQARAVSSLLESALIDGGITAFHGIRMEQDLSGIQRFVTATRMA